MHLRRHFLECCLRIKIAGPDIANSYDFEAVRPAMHCFSRIHQGVNAGVSQYAGYHLQVRISADCRCPTPPVVIAKARVCRCCLRQSGKDGRIFPWVFAVVEDKVPGYQDHIRLLCRSHIHDMPNVVQGDSGKGLIMEIRDVQQTDRCFDSRDCQRVLPDDNVPALPTHVEPQEQDSACQRAKQFLLHCRVA